MDVALVTYAESGFGMPSVKLREQWTRELNEVQSRMAVYQIATEIIDGDGTSDLPNPGAFPIIASYLQDELGYYTNI